MGIQHITGVLTMNEEQPSPTATHSSVDTMRGRQDLTGKKFHRWTVIKWHHFTPRGKETPFHHWECRCECGKTKLVEQYTLTMGTSKSCGCMMREIVSTHGKSRGENKHRLYSTWTGMRNRCNCPNNSKYYRYGGRGIKVDPRWDDFQTFLDDMLPTWKEGLTLDRKENDGNYCKENCQWSTKIEQVNNTKKNRFVEYNGERMTVAQWARKMNISYPTLMGRLNTGWPVHEALNTKARPLNPAPSLPQTLPAGSSPA